LLEDFQGHGVKGQGHVTTAVEISWTPYILNRWRELNQNLNKCLLIIVERRT